MITHADGPRARRILAQDGTAPAQYRAKDAASLSGPVSRPRLLCADLLGITASGRSKSACHTIQFRVRDSQRQRSWTFRVQLSDEIGDGGDGPRDQPFLIAVRRPQYEQATFEAEVSIGQAGGGPLAGSAADAAAASSARSTAIADMLTHHRQAHMPPSRPVIAPRPPLARPPAHLVRPGLRPRPPIPRPDSLREPELRPRLSATQRERSPSRDPA